MRNKFGYLLREFFEPITHPAVAMLLPLDIVVMILILIPFVQ